MQHRLLDIYYLLFAIQEAYTQAARVSPNLFLLVVELLVGSSAGIVQ